MRLIVAPHTDDEVLGCASFLDKDTTVLYLTNSTSIFPTSLSESQLLQQFAGFTAVRHELPIHKVASVGESVLIGLFENAIATLKPNTILLPFPSYNQDHRIAYECALTALRVHDRLPFVNRVLVYEEPDVWGTLRKVEPFKPTYFKKLDVYRKLEMWEMYRSQQRGHRSNDYIKSIAYIRGLQGHHPYAEAFEVLRWCD